MKIARFWSQILLALSCLFGRSVRAAGTEDEEFKRWEKNWDEANAAREAYYRAHIGPLPGDILKMADMFGVWVGGGLYVIHATKLDPPCWIHTTFGLSNFGEPTGVTVDKFHVETDGKRVLSSTHSAKKKEAAPQQKEGAAGYGYELIVATRDQAEWPLAVVQWVVRAEILVDTGILGRVEKYGGYTVEKIGIDGNESVNILISKAEPPFPTGTDLPNGKMELLIATVITEEEMQWCFKHGRKALLEQLQKAGVGQFSDLKRESVVK
jgi:hypothetical protein